MLKKFIASLLLVPSLAYPQEKPDIIQIETICISYARLVEMLDEFKEIPFVRGASTQLSSDKEAALVVFMNPTSKTFTIVERVVENKYCIIAVGSNFEPVPKNIVDDVIKSQQKGKL